MSTVGPTSDVGVPLQSLAQMAEGTQCLLDAVARLTDEEFHEPSSLPRWNRATVVTHLARNADALGNLLTWARTGVETPMYADPTRRVADIEAGAERSPGIIRADLQSSVDTLDAGINAMAPGCWSFPIRTAQGRELPVSVVPWLRSREVWIHAIDLDAGVTFDHLPAPLVGALLTDSLALFASRAQGAPILVHDIDSGVTTRIGGAGDPVLVSGTARELLPWVLGRPDAKVSGLTSEGDVAPTLPPWL